MKTKDIATKLNVSIPTMYAWAKKGCPHEKILKGTKSTWEWDLKKVQNWLKKQRS